MAVSKPDADLPSAVSERTALARFLPPPGLARSLCVQSVLYAAGTGVFLTGNVVFFTRIVGLSAVEVGLGLTVAGLVGLVLTVPLGAAVDRIGAKRAWAVAMALEAVAYSCYPWTKGFGGFVGVLLVIGTAQSLGNSGQVAYTLDATDRGNQVRVAAFVRSALNIGFTLGALGSGLALAIGTRTAIIALPLAAAVMMTVNAVFITRLPAVSRARDTAPAHSARSAVRDIPFLFVSLAFGLVHADQVLLTVLLPLYLVQQTAAPHALLAWLFILNTGLVVLLQVWMSRDTDTVPGAVRACRRAAVAIGAGGCAAFFAHSAPVVLASCLLVCACAAFTLAELLRAGGGWGLVSLLAPAGRRAQYQATFSLGGRLEAMLAPTAFTWLAVTWGPAGWFVIAASVLAGALLLGPAALAVQRRRAVASPRRAVPRERVS